MTILGGPLRGVGSPSSCTMAESVRVFGSVTVPGTLTCIVGGLLIFRSPVRVCPPLIGAISHSGWSQATAVSILPLVVRLHTSSFLHQSFGTVTLKTRR